MTMSKSASNLSHVSSASEIGVGVRCVDGYFDILFLSILRGWVRKLSLVPFEVVWCTSTV